MIPDISQWPRKIGKAFLHKHLNNEPLTRSEAITAKCYECSGGTGEPCSVTACPLHPFCPYN